MVLTKVVLLEATRYKLSPAARTPKMLIAVAVSMAMVAAHAQGRRLVPPWLLVACAILCVPLVSCIICPSGQEPDATLGACKTCLAGKHAISGALACADCQKNEYAPNEGMEYCLVTPPPPYT